MNRLVIPAAITIGYFYSNGAVELLEGIEEFGLQQLQQYLSQRGLIAGINGVGDCQAQLDKGIFFSAITNIVAFVNDRSALDLFNRELAVFRQYEME